MQTGHRAAPTMRVRSCLTAGAADAPRRPAGRSGACGHRAARARGPAGQIAGRLHLCTHRLARARARAPACPSAAATSPAAGPARLARVDHQAPRAAGPVRQLHHLRLVRRVEGDVDAAAGAIAGRPGHQARGLAQVGRARRRAVEVQAAVRAAPQLRVPPPACRGSKSRGYTAGSRAPRSACAGPCSEAPCLVMGSARGGGGAPPS